MSGGALSQGSQLFYGFAAMLRQIGFLFHLTRSHGIARRYFVTNGFDGALAMLGLNMGFYVAGDVILPLAISACVGTAVALAVSGLTSAYLSEAAERQRALRELEDAMVVDLDHTAHGKAARLIPLFIALVNGFSPFSLALVIILPLWLAHLGVELPLGAIESAIVVAFATIFLLGTFLGRISGTFWLWAGLRMLLIGVLTAAIILFLPGV